MLKFALKYACPLPRSTFRHQKGTKQAGTRAGFQIIARSVGRIHHAERDSACRWNGGPGRPLRGNDAEPVTPEQQLYDPKRAGHTSWEGVTMPDELSSPMLFIPVNNIQITRRSRNQWLPSTMRKISSKGFELSVKYVPMNNLSFFADYGLLMHDF